MELHTLIGRMFEKIQRVKRSPHRVLTSFWGQYDEVNLTHGTAPNPAETVPHPAFWAESEGSWDASLNFLWNEFQWADEELGSELFLNNDFESLGTGPPTPDWDDWDENPGDGTLTDETTIVHSGSHSVKATAGPSADTYVPQTVAVEISSEHKLVFYTRGDGSNAGRFRIYDVSNSQDITAVTSTGVTGTSWTSYTTYFDTPEDCTSVRVYLYCPSVNGGIAYFDLASLKLVGRNYLILDTFTDVDEASLGDYTRWQPPDKYHAPDIDTEGDAWRGYGFSPPGGDTFVIRGNKMGTPYGGSQLAQIDLGRSDGTIEVEIKVGARGLNNAEGGLVFRGIDRNNYWWFMLLDQTEPENQTWQLWYYTDGSASFPVTDWSVYAFDRDQFYTLKVVLDGSSIKCYINNVEVSSATNSAHINGTLVGFISLLSTETAIDNFKAWAS